MALTYRSKYYGDLTTFLGEGWTEEEINLYFPILESLSPEDLRRLHALCNIRMFASHEAVDEEQAIHVLVNAHDTPKELLLKSLKTMKHIA